MTQTLTKHRCPKSMDRDGAKVTYTDPLASIREAQGNKESARALRQIVRSDALADNATPASFEPPRKSGNCTSCGGDSPAGASPAKALRPPVPGNPSARPAATREPLTGLNFADQAARAAADAGIVSPMQSTQRPAIMRMAMEPSPPAPGTSLASGVTHMGIGLQDFVTTPVGPIPVQMQAAEDGGANVSLFIPWSGNPKVSLEEALDRHDPDNVQLHKDLDRASVEYKNATPGSCLEGANQLVRWEDYISYEMTNVTEVTTVPGLSRAEVEELLFSCPDAEIGMLDLYLLIANKIERFETIWARFLCVDDCWQEDRLAECTPRATARDILRDGAPIVNQKSVTAVNQKSVTAERLRTTKSRDFWKVTYVCDVSQFLLFYYDVECNCTILV